LSRDFGFCNGNEFNEVYELNQEVMRLLRTYIKKLSNL